MRCSKTASMARRVASSRRTISTVPIATSSGILNIPPLYLRAARTLGTPVYAMPYRVVIPAALPSIVTSTPRTTLALSSAANAMR